jgi:hypothetical protein
MRPEVLMVMTVKGVVTPYSLLSSSTRLHGVTS